LEILLDARAHVLIKRALLRAKIGWRYHRQTHESLQTSRCSSSIGFSGIMPVHLRVSKL
jgi:hypothetical protein